ncbi:hypothetical protein V9T40_011618 [Parthenolecanium corni]|uniref:Carboxylesterase type B domain-containing protein n=1 Tax=Parthenolecanium corni TaxID=536013 RepID=A0AAN9T5P1_9HEMI
MFYLGTSNISTFFTLVTVGLSFGSNAVEIKIQQGILKGFKQHSRNGTEYHAFLGIPYARPPIGNLRFESPQTPLTWDGVRDATKTAPSCVQIEMISIYRRGTLVIGQEDCLYLNVYAPANINKNLTVPVMVWIHGGGFFEGSGFKLLYGPDYFLDHNIIIVTINYRLGVIGFLSAADEVLPGNYGMKDQVAALKWVQQNIRDFGGDPQRVTIFGESAGAVSAHLHMFSPLSKGLFHRAISQSGTALAVWAQTSPFNARQRFFAFGILAGCSVQSTRVLVDCLKKISAEELTRILQKFYVWDMEPLMSFSVVIEPTTVTDAFLTKNPWQDNAPHEVPWIVGMNSGEGLVKATRLLAHGAKLADELNTYYKHLMPLFFGYKDWLNTEEIEETTEKLRQYYFKDKKICLETASDLVNIMTDSYFMYDTIVASQRHASTHFVYYYNHKGKLTFSPFPGNTSVDLGVSHSDESINFFPTVLAPHGLTPSDRAVSERLVKYWVNFAHSGNPTMDNSWKASKSQEIDYLHIGSESDIMQTGLLQDRTFFILVTVGLSFGSNAVEIKIQQGILKGFEQHSRNGTKYHAFLGIPYARPPIGNLRFESPQTPLTWDGVRDATKPPPSCVQIEKIFRQESSVTGQEDCLYLNVYAPANIDENLTVPVMVWIHGGGFFEGSGFFYGPEYFLDHNIIIVTINYRLGVIGFLSAADEVLPGNYGMKDQAAALKWVQQNIRDFGGDPQQVTIFGESAGAGSAHLHMFSPLSKGLFHRAISQSGTALAVWAQISPFNARQRFFAFGILAGCSVQSTRVLVDCLKKISAEELTRITQKFYVWHMEPLMSFSVVIEPTTVTDAFLTKNPWKDNAPHEVPWIVGMNSGEGLVKATRFLAHGAKLADELNTYYKRLMPLLFGYKDWLNTEEIEETTEKLRQYYFKDKKICLETASDLTNIMTDSYFMYDIIVASQRHASTHFVYYYNHKGKLTFSPFPGNTSVDLGVSHADELFSFFSTVFASHEMTPADRAVSERLVKYWVNFAHTGNPTMDNSWKASKSQEIDYLHIGSESDIMQTGLLQDRFNFWRNSLAHPINMFHDQKVIIKEL